MAARIRAYSQIYRVTDLADRPLLLARNGRTLPALERGLRCSLSIISAVFGASSSSCDGVMVDASFVAMPGQRRTASIIAAEEDAHSRRIAEIFGGGGHHEMLTIVLRTQVDHENRNYPASVSSWHSTAALCSPLNGITLY